MLLSSATVSIDANATFQTIDGFGAAMIPWKRPAEYLNASFYDQIVGDLGASMARMPVWPTFEQANDDSDPNHFNWAGFNYAGLADTMDFMQRLQERGVSKFMASVWTPPYWMKSNHSHTDGGILRPDMRQEYAEYLAAFVIAARDRWGIAISAISIQNELNFVEPYESTLYDPLQVREAVRAVHQKFQAEGLTTQILLPEDLIQADRLAWYVQPTMDDPATRDLNTIIVGHGFSGLSNWQSLQNNLDAYQHPFWMTEESGQPATWAGAMGVGEDLYQGLVGGNASAWLYWQWSDVSGSSTEALMIDGTPTPKYYAARQYFRFIRPGAQRIAATSSDSQVLVSSFRQPDDGDLTIVLLNKAGDSSDVTFNLSGNSLPATYHLYRSSAGENSVDLGELSGTSSFTLSLPASSITTLYSGPAPAPVSGAGGSAVTIQPITDTATSTALAKASLKGDIVTVRAQIAGGANVNAKASDGWTALHSAAAGPYPNSVGIIQLLLAAGASVNAATSDGWTPLIAAAANGTSAWNTSYDMPISRIQTLLQAGADINARDTQGRTALHWAALAGKMNGQDPDASLVSALIAAGAPVNALDSLGHSPLYYATQEGHDAIRTVLLAAGADDTPPTAEIVDVTPDPRTTPLNAIFITLSEPVSGLDLSDLMLSRNGGANLLSGPQTLTTTDNRTWRLGNLAGLTNSTGTYILTLNAQGSGIIDAGGNALASAAIDAWMVKAPTLSINFQPSWAVPFRGTLIDSGLPYGGRGNGYSYGWDVDNTAATRDRNSPLSADQRYDTFIRMALGAEPQHVWEIEVPNGTYLVHLIAGDAASTSGVYALNVENIPALSGTPTAASPWVQGTATVEVTDGRLTVTTAAGALNNKLDFIEIMPAAATPKVTITDVTKTEGANGAKAFRFTVKLSQPITRKVRIPYSTADGTATLADHDYTQTSGTLIIPAGLTSAVIAVPVNGDTRIEPNETFLLNLDQPTNAALADAQAVGIVLNDEVPADFAAQIDFQPAGAPTYAGYLIDSGLVFGDRGNGFAYGWNIDNTSLARDRQSAKSPDQRYDTINHLRVGTSLEAIWEMAVPNGIYTVHLVAGDALAGDPSTGDSIDKIDVEGVLGVDATPTADSPWADGTVSVQVTDGRLTIRSAPGSQNNKLAFLEIIPGGTVLPTLWIANSQRVEGNDGAASIDFTITLSQAAAQDVTVDYATSDGTAVSAENDYVPTTGTLVIPAGQTSATVSVPVNGDVRLEPDESFFVNLSNPTNATISGNQAIGTILNDESSTGVAIHINFQPAAAPTYSDYLVDSGGLYADRGNGLTYGWNVDASAGTRDRNAATSPDQRYDTHIMMRAWSGGQHVWEIGLPNGTYTVHLVAGDPSYTDSTYRMNVEDQLALDGIPTTASPWVQSTLTVTITDGRLTLTSALGAANNKVDFIDIVSLA